MRVKLGDIFEIGSGGTPSKSCPEYYGGDIPWVKTGDLKSEYIYGVEDFITEDGLGNSSAKMYEEDTVLIAMYGATIGATSILKISACTNQACAAFKRSDKVIPEYLYYFLKSQKEKFVKDGVGGAQPNISAGYLKKVEMELLSIREQRTIVDILNIIENIANKRKQEIIALDNLIKARFVEMFGDMVTNPNGWKKVLLGEACDVRDGTHDSPQYYSEGYPLVTSKNVTGGKIDFTDCSLICKEDYNKINQRSKVDYGDILMPMIGTVGNPVIVDIDGEFAIKNVALIKFRDNSAVINSFVKTLLESDYFDRAVISKVRGGTQKFISLGDIRKLEICLPPISVQEQFADFVHQVDKSKVAVQKALDETQLLFNSLMQKYFG